MPSNVKDPNDELFFVEVKEPAAVRRDILESLKNILEMLQRFENFKRMRHDKLMKMQKLRNLVKDANKIIGNLKSKMPQASLKGMIQQENAKSAKKPVQKKKEAEKPKKKEGTELDRLEAELSAIESKLKSFT